jgi:hypothetical protein
MNCVALLELFVFFVRSLFKSLSGNGCLQHDAGGLMLLPAWDFNASGMKLMACAFKGIWQYK